ncbi:hypothetical protein A5785_00525 [Gordonia sp. 852002-50395_SCH5434458]|nr:hypothetical protein A5785_00525 [Gordonia sp. 852002-50395_SCH5434458]OBC10410.1 hypothetical protein A5786_05700 [Gordonia sp. 852002-50816_SCH5313054-a]
MADLEFVADLDSATSTDPICITSHRNLIRLSASRVDSSSGQGKKHLRQNVASGMCVISEVCVDAYTAEFRPTGAKEWESNASSGTR